MCERACVTCVLKAQISYGFQTKVQAFYDVSVQDSTS